MDDEIKEFVMAWCPHCIQDRTIQRQIFQNRCAYCGQIHTLPHHQDCRGPVPGALDACTYCNTSLFAKASNEAAYKSMESTEDQILASPWSLLVRHGLANVTPERAKVIVDYIRAMKSIEAIKEIRQVNLQLGLAEAVQISNGVKSELGTVEPKSGCAAVLLLIPFVIVVCYCVTYF